MAEGILNAFLRHNQPRLQVNATSACPLLQSQRGVEEQWQVTLS